MTDWCADEPWMPDDDALFYQVGETFWDVTEHPMAFMAYMEYAFDGHWFAPRERWVSDR